MSNRLLGPNPYLAEDRQPDWLLNLVSRLSDSLDRQDRRVGVYKFQPVTEDEFIILSTDKARDPKFTKVQYHRPTELLLVIHMQGLDRLFIIAEVREMIEEQLVDMNVLDQCALGTSQLTTGDWVKEPDLCWAPRVSRTQACLFEAGTSESADDLSTTARGWLEVPQTLVKIVITVSFEKFESRLAGTNENPFTLFVWDHRFIDETRGSLDPADWMARIDVKRNTDGHLSVNGSSRDVTTRVLVETDEIRLPLEVFIGHQVENRDMVITNDKVLGIFNRLLDFGKNSGFCMAQ